MKKQLLAISIALFSIFAVSNIVAQEVSIEDLQKEVKELKKNARKGRAANNTVVDYLKSQKRLLERKKNLVLQMLGASLGVSLITLGTLIGGIKIGYFKSDSDLSKGLFTAGAISLGAAIVLDFFYGTLKTEMWNIRSSLASNKRNLSLKIVSSSYCEKIEKENEVIRKLKIKKLQKELGEEA